MTEQFIENYALFNVEVKYKTIDDIDHVVTMYFKISCNFEDILKSIDINNVKDLEITIDLDSVKKTENTKLEKNKLSHMSLKTECDENYYLFNSVIAINALTFCNNNLETITIVIKNPLLSLIIYSNAFYVMPKLKCVTIDTVQMPRIGSNMLTLTNKDAVFKYRPIICKTLKDK